MTFLCHFRNKLHCQRFAEAHDAILCTLKLFYQRLNQGMLNHKRTSAPHDPTLLYQLLSNFLREVLEVHLQAQLRRGSNDSDRSALLGNNYGATLPRLCPPPQH